MTITIERTAVAVQPAKKRRSLARRRENLAGYAFMTPWLLGFVFIIGGPMIASLYLSFTDYSVIGKTDFVGFENYLRMFTEDPRFWKSLTVTILYLLAVVPGVVIVALGLALALNLGIRGLTFYRALFYIPSLIGGSVAIALLWRAVFSSDGLFNSALALIGIDTDFSWIGEPSTARWTLVVLSVWQFGASMIIFLAGLKQIPAELYEAAKMDGAGPIRQFFAITIPMLSPIIFFNVLMTTIAAFQAFNSAYVVSNGSGGPADSTLFYTLYLYQRGFVNFQMGYASALAWVLLLIVGTVVAVFFLVSRRVVFYGDRP